MFSSGHGPVAARDLAEIDPVSKTGTLTSSGLTPTAGGSGIGPGDACVRVGVGLPVCWGTGIVGRVSRRDSPAHRPDLVVAVSKR